MPTSADEVRLDASGVIASISDATTSSLSVGYSSTGTLTVSDGGSVSSAIGHDIRLGTTQHAIGTMMVTGANSLIESGRYMFVGADGEGNLTVSNGGSVSTVADNAVTITMGANASGTGLTIVTGLNSSLLSYGRIYIGGAGTGILTVSDSASVSSIDKFCIAAQSGSTGTLNIGAASGSAAAAPGTISATNGIVFGAGTGTIVFNHTSNNYTFANAISGAGTIESLAGTTYLTGDLSGFTGTYDIQGGTLNFASSGTVTLANVFSGSSDLSFTSGTTTLTGNSAAFTGTTDVTGTGILAVNGSLGGTVDVATGGRLQGSGTVGGIGAASGGTVAPGNSIGTLSVAGDVAFAPGSTYEVEANATSSDKIVATGAANITGGAVTLIPYQGALIPAGTRWSILSAAGGVTGAFDSISFSSNSLFLTGALSYAANDVYASVTRNNTSFASVAATSNQASAAAGVESLGSGNSLYNAISWQSDAGVTRQALQALDGEIHPNIKASVLEDQAAQSRILASRMAQSQDADGFAGSPGQAPVVAQQKRPDPVQSARDRRMMARASYGDSLIPTAPAPTATRYDPAIWAQGFGDWGRRDANASAGAFKHESKGLMTGVDWMAGDHWRTGLAFGYQHADYEQDDRTGASGYADRYSLSAYGGRSWGKLSLRTGMTYAYSEIDTKRSVSFPYYSDYLKGSYNAHSVSGFAETAYTFGEKESKIEPYANLSWGYVNVPGFTEKGGAAALTAKDSDGTLGTTTLGARVRQVLPFLTSPKNKAAFQASAGWLHTIGDVNPETSLRFAGGSSFKTQAAPLARDAAVLGAGVDYLIGDQTTLGVAYTGQIGEHADTQAVRGNVSWRF